MRAPPGPPSGRSGSTACGSLRRERTVAVLFLAFGLMTFGGTMLDPLNPAWVRDVLHRGAGVFALLLVVHAASGIAGTLLVGWFGRTLSPRALIGWSSLVRRPLPASSTTCRPCRSRSRWASSRV